MATHINPTVSPEHGDHLTREEFHRRYSARPDIKKAELIDGAYVLREPDPDGIVESSQFPGLRLHVPSMLAGDAAGVQAALAPPLPPDLPLAEGV